MKCQRPDCTRKAVVQVRLYSGSESEAEYNDLNLCGPDADEAAGQYPDNIKKLKDLR